jgi:hypothetical protein
MNIYEKLANARADFSAMNVKKSGRNNIAGYDYYELKDFVPACNELALKYGFVAMVSFAADIATMTIVNSEKPEETITFTSPMSTANLKGCHDVQNLGAVQTYIRRYLYQTAFEIVESDALDSTQGKPTSAPRKRANRPSGAPGGEKNGVNALLSKQKVLELQKHAQAQFGTGAEDAYKAALKRVGVESSDELTPMHFESMKTAIDEYSPLPFLYEDKK